MKLRGYRRLTERDIIRLGDYFLHLHTKRLNKVRRCHISGEHWSSRLVPHFRKHPANAERKVDQ
jgi:hypothetical protein